MNIPVATAATNSLYGWPEALIGVPAGPNTFTVQSDLPQMVAQQHERGRMLQRLDQMSYDETHMRYPTGAEILKEEKTRKAKLPKLLTRYQIIKGDIV